MLLLQLITVLAVTLFPFNTAEKRNVVCHGELQNGRLKINSTENVQIFQLCTTLKVQVEDGTAISWKNIERFYFPNLVTFGIYVKIHESISNSDFVKDIGWFNLLLFTTGGNRQLHPNRFWTQGVQFAIFVNKVLVLYFDPNQEDGRITMEIDSLDPEPILGEIEMIYLNSLILKNLAVSYHSHIQVARVTFLRLNNVFVDNLSEFMRKFESLQYLTIYEFDNVDVCDALASKKLLMVFIFGSNLVCEKKAEMEPQSISLQIVSLHNCKFDSKFKETIQTLAPNLKEWGVDSSIQFLQK